MKKPNQHQILLAVAIFLLGIYLQDHNIFLSGLVIGLSPISLLVGLLIEKSKKD